MDKMVHTECQCCKNEREKANAEPRPLVEIEVAGLMRSNIPLYLCPFCDSFALEARIRNLSTPS